MPHRDWVDMAHWLKENSALLDFLGVNLYEMWHKESME